VEEVMKPPKRYTPRKKFGPFTYITKVATVVGGTAVTRMVYVTSKNRKHNLALSWDEWIPSGKPARITVNYDTNPCADISPHRF
jgi:hypothetical protein